MGRGKGKGKKGLGREKVSDPIYFPIQAGKNHYITYLLKSTTKGTKKHEVEKNRGKGFSFFIWL